MKVIAEVNHIDSTIANVTLESGGYNEAKIMMDFAMGKLGERHKEEVEGLKKGWNKSHIDLNQKNEELQKEILELKNKLEFSENKYAGICEENRILHENIENFKKNVAQALVAAYDVEKFKAVEAIRNCFTEKFTELTLTFDEATKLIEQAIENRS